ncbi:MAG: hypothetical protein KOO60_14065 [Gemmatimonadales bacterium]|nr:hypothetical protein [Gemmatimonadales bacterium]
MTGISQRRNKVENLALRHKAFWPEAYLFVLEALESAMFDQEISEHISGQELLEWIRNLGNDRYGVMTGDVFNAWGVQSTLDFGRIVFHLVEAGLLRKRNQDSLSDFIDQFDFDDAFALKFFEGRG